MKQAEERRKKKAVLESVASPMPSDMNSLKAEVARLRTALKEESIRADLYDEMINVAEEQFKIPIRKKLAPSSDESACTGPSEVYDRGPVQTAWCIEAGLFQERRGCLDEKAGPGGVRAELHP